MVTGWRKKRCLLCRVVVEGGPRMDKLESEVKGVVIGIYIERMELRRGRSAMVGVVDKKKGG